MSSADRMTLLDPFDLEIKKIRQGKQDGQNKVRMMLQFLLLVAVCKSHELSSRN